jgi:hypothetical protein
VHWSRPGPVGEAFQRDDLRITGRPGSDALARLDVGQIYRVLDAVLGPHGEVVGLERSQYAENVREPWPRGAFGHVAGPEPAPHDHAVADVTRLQHVQVPILGTPSYR